ncbi:MAG: hypothetical protein LBP59_06970 [Planctomycetaceae bacterium]|nr:hypothetical protein [Planctomycetaceae bacterium]
MRLYSTASERCYIATVFLFALRQLGNRDGCDHSQFFVTKKIVSLVPHVPLVPQNCSSKEIADT